MDVIVFAVKAYDTERAAKAISPIVGPDTVVITFQNGIDSVEAISRIVPDCEVIGGATYISAVLEAPGLIVHAGATRMTIGGRGNRRVEAFQHACNKRGIDAEIVDDIEAILWEKFVVLAAFSGETSLLRSGIGPILARPRS